MDYRHIEHPIPPLYDKSSRVLILGSFPSPKSREQQFFYGHPRNRFWPLLARLFEEELPRSTEEKASMLLRHHIAVWDTIFSCDIIGASDSSIKNVIPTDLRPILKQSDIARIICNGSTSGKYYSRYHEKVLGETAKVLPSTSPANAAWNFERLAEEWSILRDWCEQR